MLTVVRRRRLACVGAAVLLGVLLPAGAARAQTQVSAVPPAIEPPPQPRRPADQTAAVPQQDIWDYYRRWRKKPDPPAKEAATGLSKVIMPIFSSKPSTGFVVGLGASLERPRGSLDDTYVSSTLVSASVTTKKQYSIVLRPAWFGAGNDWLVSGDNHFQQAGQDTYGLGTSAPAGAAVAIRYHSIKFSDVYYRELWKGVYAGAGFQYQQQSNVKPADEDQAAWVSQPYYRYSTQAGFDPAGQTAAGFSVGVRRDTRDNISDPHGGWLLDTTWRAYMADFLGGDSTWQRLYVDLRAYQPLTRDASKRLAMWVYSDVVTHGTAPYLSLPATGTDTMARSGRGYAEGRFRGERLVYGELEYRASLTRDGVLGWVAFVNATTVGSATTGERLFDTVALGGGVGLRARLQKRSRTNICLDVGFGREGARGLYIGLAEAF